MLAIETNAPLSALAIAESTGIDYPHLWYSVLPNLQAARLITITKTKPGTAMQFGRGDMYQMVMLFKGYHETITY